MKSHQMCYNVLHIVAKGGTLKTKPIGIRFNQGEYDLISDYARREGETFSEVVRKGAICYVSPDHFKGYRSLAQLASSAEVDDMELLFDRGGARMEGRPRSLALRFCGGGPQVIPRQ